MRCPIHSCREYPNSFSACAFTARTKSSAVMTRASGRFTPPGEGCATFVVRVSGGTARPQWSGALQWLSVRAPISSVAAARPRFRDPSPCPRERAGLVTGSNAALDSGRNFTPGRQKSLGAHGAPACTAGRIVPRMARPEGRAARRFLRSTRTSEDVGPGITHLLSTEPRSHGLSRPVGRADRTEVLIVLPRRRNALLTHRRGPTQSRSLSSAPRGRRRIRSARRPDPGPRRSWPQRR
jgi:hypothetical protein